MKKIRIANKLVEEGEPASRPMLIYQFKFKSTPDTYRK